jgi:photosystem II stability/assembly factor-like uncharacterized protein
MQCDPVDPMRVFVNNYLGGNFLSTDGGQTWATASQGYTGAQIRQVNVAPHLAWIIYAGGRAGMFRSEHSGDSWTGLANPGPGMSAVGMNEVLSITLDPADPHHLLASAEVGTILSYDGGQSWQMSSGLPELAPGMAFAPSNPTRVYAVVVPGKCVDPGTAPADKTECDESDVGLYVSENGGISWSPAGGAEPSGKAMISVAVHPTNPNIVYAGTFIYGVLKTSNGGETWTSGTGLLPNASAISLAIAPSDPDIVFAGFDGAGVYRSTNGGESWVQTSAGLTPEAQIKSIVVDPTDSQIVYAADFFSGVYVSTNGGDTWQAINEGLVHRTANALTLSEDGAVLYLGIEGDGVYRLGVPQSARVYLPMVLRLADG